MSDRDVSLSFEIKGAAYGDGDPSTHVDYFVELLAREMKQAMSQHNLARIWSLNVTPDVTLESMGASDRRVVLWKVDLSCRGYANWPEVESIEGPATDG